MSARPKLRSEWDEQCDLVAVLDVAGLYYTAVPMGGHMSARMGAARRRAGARAGWPDLQITTREPARPDARGVAIELKAAHLRGLVGGRPTPEQLACHERLRADGWLVYVCHGVHEAVPGVLRSLGYRV